MTEHGRSHRQPGFRARVIGLCAVLLVVAAGLGLVAQRTVLRNQLDRTVDASLEQERTEIERLASGLDPNTGEPFGDDVAAIFETFLTRSVPSEGEVYLTFVDTQPFLATPAPDGVRLDLDEDLVERWGDLTVGARGTENTDAGPIEYLAVPLQSDGQTAGVFVVANFVQDRRDQIDAGIRIEAVASALVLVVALGAAWLLAGRLLRPVRRLTDTARSITESDLTARIPVETDDEIGELAVTFNDMIDRLDEAFATQRRFIDDAGHELRTPITIVRGQLEVMTDDPDERRETIALVTDELDRMARIVNDLLLLAKAEQPDFIHPVPVELNDFTTGLLMKARALGDRRWTLDDVAEGEIAADPDRLAQAMLNLARNAVEHTGTGDEIAIGSAAESDHTALWVRDTGPGVPDAERSHLFERFRRGRERPRNSEGAGLGLAIVHSIARGHGGTVRLDDPDGGGARFTITLPEVPDARRRPAAPRSSSGGDARDRVDPQYDAEVPAT